MIQINAIKNVPNGIARITMRFIGKNIFIRKKENSPESINMINKFKQSNVRLWESREWIKIDMLGDNEAIKIGDDFLDKDMSEEEMEKNLSNFYIQKYKQGGFIVEIQEV
jgi:hypothetical protein